MNGDRASGAVAWAVSAAIHGALLAAGLAAPPAQPGRGEEVAVEIEEAPAAPEPRPEAAPLAAAPVRRLPPAPAAPPPPERAAPDAAPPRRGPVRVGVALEATAETGGFAAPVGNTLLGKPPEVAPDPASVGTSPAGRVLPPTRVDELPVCAACEIPREEYPLEARREGLEGVVRLRIQVDEEGRVREARILSDPGMGLGAAAARGVRAHCRCRPGRLDGVPVATEIVYEVRFELP